MAYEFEIRDVPAQPALFIRHTCKQAEIGLVVGKLLPEVMARLSALKVQPAGPAFCRYTSWRDQDCDLEAGFPLAAEAAATDRVLSGQVGGSKAAYTTHVGPYEGLPNAYEAATEWVVDNSKELNGAPWETYVTSPMETKDPHQYKTEIYMPIKG